MGLLVWWIRGVLELLEAWSLSPCMSKGFVFAASVVKEFEFQ